MLRWIAENKSWLFSGVGLTLVGALWWLLKSGYAHWKQRRATYLCDLPGEILAEVLEKVLTLIDPAAESNGAI